MKHSCILLPSFALALALLSGPALAQTDPPVLGTPPTAPAPAAPPAPSAPLPASVTNDPYILGRTYRVETTAGTSFTGKLMSMSLTMLEFDTQELGRITLERDRIRRAYEQEAGKTRNIKASYFDAGNGNRLFFAPTGRGLRKGEATLQNVNLFVMGLNYGVTDNLSLGGYVSLIPWLSPDEQVLVLTPKVSFPVSEKVHMGAGLLYVRVPNFDTNNSGIGVGVGYGALTYGSADDNLTFGLGYGFVEGEIGSTPLLQVGGQKRVSRRVSLVSENYIVADSQAGAFGLYGTKINWPRASLGLGAAYIYDFGYNSTSASLETTYIVPVYADFTFRFGKGAK